MSFEIGQVIADKYQLVDKIGKGGMGTVYRAWHLTLQKDVALKTLHQVYAMEEEHRLRFEREARVAAALDHDNAISIIDFGWEDDALFIVMEMLSGVTLKQMRKKGEPMDQETALNLAWQVADCLVEAHHIGLVHRDLKPANIMVETRSDNSLRAVVVDFGLAFIHQDENLARLTQEGIISGTPAFVSPEQAQGGHNIGPESDVYSFGCVMYEMFTGQQIFQGTSLQLLTQHVLTPAPSPMQNFPDANIPPALDSLILSMLEKDAEQRPSIQKVREWLGALVNKKTPRDRGKPERFLSERSHRAVTLAMHDAPTPTRDEGAGVRPLGIIGAIDPEWELPLQAAGFGPVEIELEQIEDYPVVVSLSDDLETIKTWSEHAEVIVVSSAPMSHVTELLRVGAKDVVTAPIQPSSLVKKVERVWKKLKRKSE